MNNDAQFRLNEIIFCNLFKHLLKKNRNPVKVYNMLEVMASVVDGNIIILNSVINIILNNDRRYMPTKKEYVAALRECGVPVRRTLAKAGMSFSTYYKWKDEEMVIKPRFTPAQYTEMMKILNLFSDLYEKLEGFDGHSVYESDADDVPAGME